LENEFGSPFYLIDKAAFVANYDNIIGAFGGRYDNFILAYSYKTNYIPYLCKIVASKGGYAEVVSRLEYELALKIGQEPNKIIFNGPVKCYDDIELALNNDSIVNLDSQPEIEHVNKYAQKYPSRQIKVGLRINIGLSDQAGVSHIQESLAVGRFGFSPESEQLKATIAELSRYDNVRINSLHGHTSTSSRSTWCYKVITETLCDIAQQYLPGSIEYINIGGGIFGDIPPEMRWKEIPSFDEYADVVCDVLKSSDWAQKYRPYLVLEPGVAMVANALSFVTKVVSVKEIKDKLFVTVDGSAFNTKPTFHKINPPYELIKEKTTSLRRTYSVVGSTCMEKDYLLTDISDIELSVGDYIRIDSVGAYTAVLTPPFINVAPAILVENNGSYQCVRRRQSLDDMFNTYYFG
jgi:diaminopimelate decarboxylase